MIDFERLKVAPEDDAMLQTYMSVTQSAHRNPVEALADLEAAKSADLSPRNLLGLGAWILNKGHDDTPKSAELTRSAFAVFDNQANKSVSDTVQYWHMVETLARHQPDIQDVFEKLVISVVNNIKFAPLKITACFDAILRSHEISNQIKELVAGHYIRKAGCHIEVGDFASTALFAVKENAERYGRNWIIDRLV